MRVVSLLPAGTEIVAALGALETLVGVTHECDFPAVVRSRARVTRSEVDARGAPATVDGDVRRLASDGAPLYALDEQRIAALRPELILTQKLCDVCAVSEADVRALAGRLSPAPRVLTLAGDSFDGVLGDIGTVAEALGCEDERDELVTGLRARLRAVHGVLKEHEAPRPRVAVIEWTDPLYTAGHWVPEMIRRAGGQDVLSSPGAHSARTTADAVRAADPEVLLVAPCGYDLARAAQAGRELLAQDEWAWARGRRVWAVDANGLVSRPGPRLVDGVEVFARVFHPELFSPLDDGHATPLGGAQPARGHARSVRRVAAEQAERQQREHDRRDHDVGAVAREGERHERHRHAQDRRRDQAHEAELDDRRGLEPHRAGEDGAERPQRLRLAAKDAVVHHVAVVGREVERAADRHHGRGDDHAPAQHDAEQLLHAVVARGLHRVAGHPGPLAAHSIPRAPLYSICTAITMTTMLNRMRSFFGLAFVSTRAPNSAPASTPSITGKASAGSM